MSIQIKRWFITISCFLWLLSSGITFVIFFEPLFHWSIQWFGLQTSASMDATTLQLNYHVLIAYLTRPWVSELVMPNFSSSSQGLFHFMEVKRLFMVNFAILLMSSITSVLGLRYLSKRKKLWYLLSPIRIMFVIPIFVVIALLSFFDVIFVKFHELFFHNSAWIFDPNLDPIIEALPEPFFMVCFVIVFVWLLAGLGILYTWIKHHSKLVKRGIL